MGTKFQPVDAGIVRGWDSGRISGVETHTAHQPRIDRSNNFDFLRLFFATLVIFSHSYSILGGDAVLDPASRFTRGQTSFGGIAVDCFFIMSGFLITASWQRSSGLGSYLGKRIRRIYPGFFGVLVFTALVVVPLSGGSMAGVRTVIVHAIELSQFPTVGAFPGNPIPRVNGSLWTVRYEFICYLMVAAMGMVGLLRHREIVLACLGVLALLDIAVGGEWLRLLLMFFAGMTAWLYREHLKSRTIPIVGALLSMTLAAFIPHAWHPVFAISGAYLVFAFAFSSVPLSGVARHGDLSYGVYLYAFPVQQLVVRHFHPSTPFALFSATLPVVFVLAIASWHVIERPMMKRKN